MTRSSETSQLRASRIARSLLVLAFFAVVIAVLRNAVKVRDEPAAVRAEISGDAEIMPVPLDEPSKLDERQAVGVAITSSPEHGSLSRDAIAVRVLDDGRKPLANVEVQVHLEDDDHEWRGPRRIVRTNDDGACSVDLSPPRGEFVSWIVVWCDAPLGYVGRTVRVPIVMHDVEVVLVRGARLSGHVSYVDGSLPGPGARLSLHGRTSDNDETEEDAFVVDGTYSFGPKLSGALTHAELEDPTRPLARLEFPPFHLEPGSTSCRDFAFERGATLAVTFRDVANGVAIAGAHALGLRNDELASDDNGRLVMADALGAGCRTTLQFTHPDFVPQWRQLTGLPHVQTVELDIQLSRGLTLGGVVEDPRGVPQVGLTVRVEQRLGARSKHRNEPAWFKRETVTDGDGRFRLPGMPPRGSFAYSIRRCTVMGTHSSATVLSFGSFTMPEASRREHWLVQDHASILGRVVDANGVAVAKVEVLATAAGAGGVCGSTTDDAGRFRIDNTLPGVWRLSVQHGPEVELASHSPCVRQVSSMLVELPATGSSDITLRLSPERTKWPERPVRVRLLDGRTRAEVDTVEWISWSGIDSTLSTDVSGTDSRDNGLSLSLPIGTYELGVRAIGFAPAAAAVEIVEGEGAQEIELALESED